MRPSLCSHGRQRHLRRRRSGWGTSSHAPDLWPKGVCRESRISLQIDRDRNYAPYAPERVSEEDFDREFDARASLAGDGSFQLTVTLGDIGKPDPHSGSAGRS